MDPSKGRGRGEKPDPDDSQRSSSSKTGGPPMLSIADRRSSADSGGETEPAIRGRGGFRSGGDLRTIPDGVSVTRADHTAKGQPVNVMANFVRIQPMKERDVYQYRVDFEPPVESVSLRRKLFQLAIQGTVEKEDIVYDGTSDARTSRSFPSSPFEKDLDHPVDKGAKVKVIIKKVGLILWSSFEMLRLYNMNMKKFLRELKFFQVSATGAFVHPNFRQMVANNTIAMVRGFRTACNIHESSNILVNLESVHKLIQYDNLLAEMRRIFNMAQNSRQNAQAAVKTRLVGKLVVPSYNRRTYRIEDVNFSLNPLSTFPDQRNNTSIRYVDYFKNRYDKTIQDPKQPLLLVTDNSKRRAESAEPGHDIYLVPELCNLAGLTDEQRADGYLKRDLINSSQVAPLERVKQAREFLEMLHKNTAVREHLDRWGYSIDKNLVELKARIVPTETVGVGQTANQPPQTWPKVDNMGSFDRMVTSSHLAVVPDIRHLAIIISSADERNEGPVLSRLQTGIQKVGLNIEKRNVNVVRLDGNSAHLFASKIRQLPADTSAAIVIMPGQNKERYDAIKRVATVERGLITQVVTTKLMTQERKAGGAAIKIGIQLAAKVGGEPWHVFLPLGGLMVCGYDTYHDTSNRGRSFGAFIASTNRKLSRWFSKADAHDKLDELSANMAENMSHALNNYKRINGSFPERVVLYRDGVSDGQLEHVFKVELSRVRSVVEDLKQGIKLTIVVVNKRIGARFYMKSGDGFINPPPGTVIDDVITRESRYDFYLISQSTRNGTINPTYYNIIYDTCGLSPDKHQLLAFKLCSLYYNWTGTVRVPAPCQYAHKLAYLCGEHLHSIPNAVLDDRLHFL